MAVTINRGLQMDQFRQDRCLTDVELVSETVSLHCHKLVLSLHSSYFRNRVHPIGHRFCDENTIFEEGEYQRSVLTTHCLKV